MEEIEPCLPFWIDRLGFQKTGEVPEGDKLGFVMLARDGVEIMYQSRASVAKDVGVARDVDVDNGEPLDARTGSIDPSRDQVVLYLEVDNLSAAMEALKGVPVILLKCKTFYGS